MNMFLELTFNDIKKQIKNQNEKLKYSHNDKTLKNQKNPSEEREERKSLG